MMSHFKWLQVVIFILLPFIDMQAQVRTDVVSEGIYKVSLGKDIFTPFDQVAGKPALERNVNIEDGELPFRLEDIQIVRKDRGIIVSVPLTDDEQIYGFGLQVGSFGQRGLRRELRVNAQNLDKLGFSHAPFPFYVSTEGYGIAINTSRYVTVLCGTNRKKSLVRQQEAADGQLMDNEQDLYDRKDFGNYVTTDIKGAEGIEVFVFTGKTITQVLQRYNLFSGGGCLPPIWGLGLKYRPYTRFVEDDVRKVRDYFIESEIPCEVMGLEPGWHTHAYPCSYVWNKERYHDPEEFVQEFLGKGFRLNLWEHAWVHESSPIYDDLYDKSADYVSMNGLAPDFVDPEVRGIFSEHHKKLIAMGVSGFKLDECDNSCIYKADKNWGVPNMAEYPSGIDGEQMHQLMGGLYMKSILQAFEECNQRTYCDYRASSMFASSYPAVLYSDLNDWNDYITMVSNAGFAGLLWSPEVRKNKSEVEFLRKMQLSLMSAESVVNAWAIKLPPWLYFSMDEDWNMKDPEKAEFMENIVRRLVCHRMRLVPYLYSSFFDYYLKGIPPFRALVTDYTGDKNTFDVHDQFLIGQNLMAAPLHTTDSFRNVYFPEGTWYDYNTGKKYEGGKTYMIDFALDVLPLFVKAGTILPLAEPVQHMADDIQFKLDFRVYGDVDSEFVLYEDDGVTYDYRNGEYKPITVSYKSGKGIRTSVKKSKRYDFGEVVIIR